jgi:hypothetical protein
MSEYIDWLGLAEQLMERDARIAELRRDLESNGRMVLEHEARADAMQHERDLANDDIERRDATIARLRRQCISRGLRIHESDLYFVQCRLCGGGTDRYGAQPTDDECHHSSSCALAEQPS